MNLMERSRAAEALFKAWVDRPLRWGEADCVLMAADMFRRLGVPSPLKTAPKWRGPRTALRALQRKGCATLFDAVDMHAGRLPAPLFAMAGDIVALPSDDPAMPALAVCIGPDGLICFGPDVDEAGAPVDGSARARRVDMQMALVAWRIG